MFNCLGNVIKCNFFKAKAPPKVMSLGQTVYNAACLR